MDAARRRSQAPGEIRGCSNYLLTWLLEDEKKHDKLLADLSLIKRAMYP